MPRKLHIRVPSSTSNIGPGFDVLGATLSIYLTLTATVYTDDDRETVLTYSGDKPATVPLTLSENLITRTASYMAAAHNKRLPPMDLHIDNPIPLGRGLGSSGAAVVAGVILGDLACGLDLSREELLDYCLVIEGHPDNVTASLMGGFCASYLAVGIEGEHAEYLELEKSGRLMEIAAGVVPNDGITRSSTGLPIPPIKHLGHYVRLPLHSGIRATVVVPDFELSTKLARSVLPTHYSRADVVFNLQRLAVLTTALSSSSGTTSTEPSPDLIYKAMQDRLHQHYRQHLVPGLPSILALNPADTPGLLGICVSGAGPTVLALVASTPDENVTAVAERVGTKIKGIWAAWETGIEWELQVETERGSGALPT
ncbi:ribosomal protein S5 domain 2-type protein [Phlyctochytrium arcticum]|nr:ribosomal protein S5 domain 2-type protein [Phlyctochytrium arcticum]